MDIQQVCTCCLDFLEPKQWASDSDAADSSGGRQEGHAVDSD